MDMYGNNYANQFQPWQQQQRTQNSGPWIVVPTVQQIEQVSVQPNGKAWIMAQNEAIFALRSADQMGLVTTDYYRFEKINPEQMQQSGQYVTKEEMNAAIEAAVQKAMGGISNESNL